MRLQTEPSPGCVGMQLSGLEWSSDDPSQGKVWECGGHIATPAGGERERERLNHATLDTKKTFDEDKEGLRDKCYEISRRSGLL